MTRAEQIIVRRIHELQDLMDTELDAQIEAENDNDSVFDVEASDRMWQRWFDCKCELVSLLAEIRGCDLSEVLAETRRKRLGTLQ